MAKRASRSGLGLRIPGFLFVGLGRPFEPAKYSQGSLRFSNHEYQRLFEEAKNHPEASRVPAGDEPNSYS